MEIIINLLSIEIYSRNTKSNQNEVKNLVGLTLPADKVKVGDLDLWMLQCRDIIFPSLQRAQPRFCHFALTNNSLLMLLIIYRGCGESGGGICFVSLRTELEVQH